MQNWLDTRIKHTRVGTKARNTSSFSTAKCTTTKGRTPPYRHTIHKTTQTTLRSFPKHFFTNYRTLIHSAKNRSKCFLITSLRVTVRCYTVSNTATSILDTFSTNLRRLIHFTAHATHLPSLLHFAALHYKILLACSESAKAAKLSQEPLRSLPKHTL